MTQRILFDQGVPVPLKRYLKDFNIETLYGLGWSSLENGELLAKAQVEGYDIFLTTDKNLKYQQNISERTVAIVVLPTPRWPILLKHIDEILAAISSVTENEYVEIKLRIDRNPE